MTEAQEIARNACNDLRHVLRRQLEKGEDAAWIVAMRPLLESYAARGLLTPPVWRPDTRQAKRPIKDGLLHCSFTPLGREVARLVVANWTRN